MLLLLLGWAGIGLQAADLPYFEGSFEALRAEAREQDKPILLWFYTEWCQACPDFEAEVLGNSEISGVLSRDFLLFKLNAESVANNGFQLAAQYQVSFYPTVLLLKPDGSVGQRLMGQQSQEAVATALKTLRPQAAVAAKPTPKPAASGSTTRSPAANLSRRSSHPGWYLVELEAMPERGYGVQVGVFTDYDTVLDEIAWLRQEFGYPTMVSHTELNGYIAFRVAFGPFPDRSKAVQFEQEFEQRSGRSAFTIGLGQ